MIDSSGAEELKEPHIEAQNFLPSRGKASTSREGAVIGSLREGLLAYPLEALMEVLLEEFMSAPGTGSSGELAEVVFHA